MRLKPHFLNKNDHDKARVLRKTSSPVEDRFWFELRKACAGQNLKFRRQQPIHPYFADFACMKAKLLVELDGPSHNDSQLKDEKRDDYLRQQGYTVLRINNDDVMNNSNAVIEVVIRKAKILSKPR